MGEPAPAAAAVPDLFLHLIEIEALSIDQHDLIAALRILDERLPAPERTAFGALHAVLLEKNEAIAVAARTAFAANRKGP